MKSNNHFGSYHHAEKKIYRAQKLELILLLLTAHHPSEIKATIDSARRKYEWQTELLQYSNHTHIHVQLNSAVEFAELTNCR